MSKLSVISVAMKSVYASASNSPLGTPLVERISERVYGCIKSEATDVLQPFITPAGTLDAPLVGHLVAARPAA